jgi:hypothetical protein
MKFIEKILTVYFQVLPIWAQAETYQKLVQTPYFMVLITAIKVVRTFRLKNLQKGKFGEGQVQDPNPAVPQIKKFGRILGRYIVLSLYSNFQLSWCRNNKKTGNRRMHGRTDGQRNDFNRAHLKKNALKNFRLANVAVGLRRYLCHTYSLPLKS